MRRKRSHDTEDSGWWTHHAPMIAALAAIGSASTAVAAFGGMSTIAVTNDLSSEVMPDGLVPLPPVVIPEAEDAPTPPLAAPEEAESTVPDSPTTFPPGPPEAKPDERTFTMTQSTGHGPTEEGRRWIAKPPPADTPDSPTEPPNDQERDGLSDPGDE